MYMKTAALSKIEKKKNNMFTQHKKKKRIHTNKIVYCTKTSKQEIYLLSLMFVLSKKMKKTFFFVV